MRQQLLADVRRSVGAAFPAVDEAFLERVTLEAPRDSSHGDYASNVAFLLKDVVKDNPRNIAQAVVAELPADALASAEVLGPGFINFRIRPERIHAFLRDLADPARRAEMLRAPELAQQNGRVQIEFVSANPTGPMNVVSARAAAFGDASVRLLRAAGVEVRSEFYVNDEGNQARLFGESLSARFQQAAGRDVPLPEDGYRGADVTELGRGLMTILAARIAGGADAKAAAENVGVAVEEGRTIGDLLDEAEGGADSAPAAALSADAVDAALARIDFARLGIQSMMANAQASLRMFGVEFDEWFRESTLHRADETGMTRVEQAEQLLEKGGHLREEDGARWFVATRFGDDKDRVVRRSDGQSTYLLADVAYHLDKAARGFDRVVDVWGPDHHGYIQRLQAAVTALGQPEGWLEIRLVQQVNLLRDGEPVKMSKRGGELVTLDELVEEVGKDVSRFFFLMRRSSTHLDFDLELAKKESMENPVFYVQYAHARTRSIFKQPMASEILADAAAIPDLSLLDAEEEIAMMRTLLQYPETVQEAARAMEPHRLVSFLREVAGSYHRFYTRGKQDASFRVLGADHDVSRARLFLVRVLADVLREGLGLLGIEALESM